METETLNLKMLTVSGKDKVRIRLDGAAANIVYDRKQAPSFGFTWIWISIRKNDLQIIKCNTQRRRHRNPGREIIMRKHQAVPRVDQNLGKLYSRRILALGSIIGKLLWALEDL